MITDFDAIVYDLDGTLVRLAVNWNAVAREAAAVLERRGVEADGIDLWEMLDVADERGARDDVEAVIGDYECDGARRSERLPLADEVPERTIPVGVCSLNCERACRIALDVHDIDDNVGCIVGRDTVATRKPDPEPLLTTLRGLDVSPERALFVGDSTRDELTAERGGVAFRYVDGGPSNW